MPVEFLANFFMGLAQVRVAALEFVRTLLDFYGNVSSKGLLKCCLVGL